MIDERGSMMPMAMALVLVTLIVVALALDVTLYAAAVREVAFAADAGAEAGAARIDPAARYRGALLVDPEAARTAAEIAASETRPRPGREIDVSTEPARVCVAVRQPFNGNLVAVQSTIVVTACAVPMEG